MPLTATAGFDLVMAGRKMRVAGVFTLALPVVGYTFTNALQSINLDATNQTDLPDTVRETVGFGTMGGSATFAGPVGQGLKAYELLNPDNPVSPMYRQQVKGALVTWSAGVRVRGAAAAETLLGFTGRVSSISVDHEAKTITLGLVDLTVDWGQTPDIPAVVTAPPYNAGLTSEFAMDQLVRFYEGASTWPAQRPQCVLAVGMRSSIWPEVGSLADSATIGGDQLVPTFAPGVFGSALNSLSTTATTTSYANLVYILSSGDLGTRVFVEFWVDHLDASSEHFIGLSSAAITFNEIYMKVHSTGITIGVVGFSGNEFTWTTAINGSGHYIAASIVVPAVGGTVSSATLYLDGASQATGTLNWGGPRDAVPMNSLWVSTDGHGTIEALQVSLEAAPAVNYPFTPQAVLDTSLNPLTVVPAIAAGSTGLDLFQQMAAAELGYARRGPDGVFRFTNRNTIAQAAVARTVTSRVSLKGFTTSDGDSTEYDRVDVPYTEWTFGAATLVWSLASKKRIRPGQTVTWTQQLPDGVLAAAIDTTASLLPNTHSVTDGHSWYRASLDSSGINAYTGRLPITITRVGPGAVVISVYNPSRSNVWLTSPSTYTDTTTVALGGPALWIGGVPATASDEATVSATIGAGANPLALSSNPYLQDHDTALALGQYVLQQVYIAIRNFTNASIVPDSRAQITDKHLLQDPDRSEVNEYVLVWGSHFSADFTKGSESWQQSLDYRAIAAAGGWIGEVAGRSEGEQTTYGY